MRIFLLQLGTIVVLSICPAMLFAEENKAVNSDLRRVRIIYIVSADRDENPEYTKALEHAIRDLQK